MADVDLSTLLALAVELVRSAGRRVVEGREQALSDEDSVDTKSTPTDVVTVMDREAEQQIVRGLLAARPKDGILGEEGGERQGSSGVRWLVDPIDGTVNYLYGIPEYAVSLGAELDGEMVVGAVYNPVTRELWTAIRGEGARLRTTSGTRRVAGSAVGELGQALIATGFGYDAERRARQAAVVAALLPEVRDIRRMGAASLDLCAAAMGRVDGYFERGLSPWDFASGALIAAEAGLRVTGLNGAGPDTRMVLAAPPALHARLHERLVALHADEGP